MNPGYPANIICPEPHVRLLVRGTDRGICLHGGICMNHRRMVCLLLLFSFLALLAVPVVASVDPDTIPASRDPLAENNPEMIAAQKTHVAYVSQTQQARMDGVIAYIDRISGGNGTMNLRNIEDDYLDIASSIPVMQTSDDITAAREDLRTQTQLFSEETKARLIQFNGNSTDMRGAATASVQSMENSISTLRASLWLARETARITVFNRESQERSALLSTIGQAGIDTTSARNISDQIDIRRSAVQKALADNSTQSLKETNSGLKALNHQFREAIQTCRDDLRLQMNQAAVLALNQG